MTRRPLVTLLAGALGALAALHAAAQAAAPKLDYANGFDQALAGVLEARGQDWRDGAVVVLLNPSDRPVTDTVLVANSKLVDGSRTVNLLADKNDPDTPAAVSLHAALVDVTPPAHGFVVLKPGVAPPGAYTNYKRLK